MAVLGIDLGGTNIKAGLVDSNGTILKRKSLCTKADEGKDNVLGKLYNLCDGFFATAASEGMAISGIGIGTPGPALLDKGIIITLPNFPDWNNVPLTKILKDRFGIPVILENDANAFAYGEYVYGFNRRYRNMLGITLGTGLGGGIIIDGKIYHGKDGTAGELGHITIQPDGAECGCGNNGCLETYVSANALIRIIPQKLDQWQAQGKKSLLSEVDAPELTPRHLYQAAENDDELSRSIFFEMGRWLGIGFADLVNIFNPEIIVLGGGLTEAVEYFLPIAITEMKKRAFTTPADSVKIEISKLGHDSAILGVAALCQRDLFGLPDR